MKIKWLNWFSLLVKKQTSEQWQRECLVEVIDPDGWNRKNFDYSWYKEKITKGEFEKRLMLSTCSFPRVIDWNNIWEKGLFK